MEAAGGRTGCNPSLQPTRARTALKNEKTCQIKEFKTANLDDGGLTFQTRCLFTFDQKATKRYTHQHIGLSPFNQRWPKGALEKGRPVKSALLGEGGAPNSSRPSRMAQATGSQPRRSGSGAKATFAAARAAWRSAGRSSVPHSTASTYYEINKMI